MTATPWSADKTSGHPQITGADDYYRIAEVGDWIPARHSQWCADAEGIAKLRNLIPEIISALRAGECAGLEVAAKWHEEQRPQLSGPEYGLASDAERKSMRASHDYHTRAAETLRSLAQPLQGVETLAAGCCSASSPCNHQKSYPSTICATCEAARQPPSQGQEVEEPNWLNDQLGFVDREAEALKEPAPPAQDGAEWQLVPKEPTDEMLDTYWHYTGESKEMRARTHTSARRFWSEMLSASPTPASPERLALAERLDEIAAYIRSRHLSVDAADIQKAARELRGARQ
jgi:hypothetical protein